MLCRLRFLIPGLLLYILGFLLAVAYGADLDLERFVLGYLIFFTAHLSLHLSNDYFDQKADFFNSPTAVSGGSGILKAHPELARLALALSLSLIVISLLIAIYFQVRFAAPWYFFPLVLVGNGLGFFYTAPPIRLAYRGLGELSTAFAAGVLMPGMGYLSAINALDHNFLILTPAFLSYGMFFILNVEMPDAQGDREGGKVNLMVKYGVKKGYAAILLSISMGTFLFIALSFWGSSSALDYRWFMFFSLIPLAVGLAGARIDLGDRSQLIRQVKGNIASLIVFLLLIDAYLLTLI
jgi:1,4-dihydroxy-2-naphthoate octaprenyltransferase